MQICRERDVEEKARESRRSGTWAEIRRDAPKTKRGPIIGGILLENQISYCRFQGTSDLMKGKKKLRIKAMGTRKKRGRLCVYRPSSEAALRGKVD